MKCGEAMGDACRHRAVLVVRHQVQVSMFRQNFHAFSGTALGGEREQAEQQGELLKIHRDASALLCGWLYLQPAQRTTSWWSLWKWAWGWGVRRGGLEAIHLLQNLCAVVPCELLVLHDKQLVGREVARPHPQVVAVVPRLLDIDTCNLCPNWNQTVLPRVTTYNSST